MVWGVGDKREREELETFCARALPELTAALTHQFGDPWLGQDLAQEAVVRACDRWAQVRELSAPTGWAFRVGVNLGRSRLRRRAAERRALARRGADVPDADQDLADGLDVRAALQRLSPAAREVLIVRYVLGLSVAETAALIGISEAAVRTRTSRAADSLRVHLSVRSGEERRG